MADEVALATGSSAPIATAGTERVGVQSVDTKKPDPITDASTSDLPYHTANTEKIQAGRAKELEGKEKEPYKYQFNGYTVVEVKQVNPLATEEKSANTIWKVTADGVPGFEKSFNDQRAAEIFAETHSPQFAKNAAIKTPAALKDAPTA